MSTCGEVQLIVIGKDDFHSIFQSIIQPSQFNSTYHNETNPSSQPHLGSYNNPDDNDDLFDWLKKIAFLIEWPVNLLNDEEKAQIRLHRIPRGRLLTDNTNSSEFIYIVKIGSVSVWLRPFNPSEAVNNNMSRVKDTLASNFEDEPPKNLSYFPEKLLLKGHHDEILKKLKIQPRNHSKQNEITTTEPIFSQLESFRESLRVGEKMSLTNTVVVYHQPTKKLKSRAKLRLPQVTTVLSSRKSMKKSGTKLPTVSAGIRRGEMSRSVRKYEMKKDEKSMTGMLKVKTLYAGDYCGLNDLLFDDQPPLQLISLGCECVLLPKSLFIKYSNIERLKNLRSLEKSYPDFESVESTLKNYSDWKTFKQNVLLVGLDS